MFLISDDVLNIHFFLWKNLRGKGSLLLNRNHSCFAVYTCMLLLIICVSGNVHQPASCELRQHGHRYCRMPSLSRHSLSPALLTSWSNNLTILYFSVFKEVVWVTPLYETFQRLPTTRKPQECFIFSTLGISHFGKRTVVVLRGIHFISTNKNLAYFTPR